MAKRPYSKRFTAKTASPRRYLLSGIPPTLWDRARARAKREGVSMRHLLLSLVETWSSRPDDPLTDAQVEAEAAVRRRLTARSIGR